MTLAKDGGVVVPIDAYLTSPDYADVLLPGDHGSTFAGGPVQCAAALAVLDVVQDEGLLARVRELGERRAAARAELRGVVAVRGRGLMLAAALDPAGSHDAPSVVRRALLEE